MVWVKNSLGTLNFKALGERMIFSCTTGRGIAEEAEQSALISRILEEGLSVKSEQFSRKVFETTVTVMCL